MNDLIERIEAASGPDREIDLAIDLGARPDQWAQVCHDNPASVPTQWCDDDELPRYSASIDAALTLVPDDWTAWEMRSHSAKKRFSADLSRLTEFDSASEDWVNGRGATPALALCAAALKSRAYLKETNNG